MASIQTRIENRAEGEVAIVTVDNEAKLNSLTAALIEDLKASFLALADNVNLRLAVLTGAGDRAFIGGANVGELAELDEAASVAFITNLHLACQAMRDLPVPVIARINGYCLGAGLEIAVACDMRIAVDSARFAMPEVRVGIPSVIEAALLPRLIGWGKTAELVMTGDMIGADEALQCNLVERVVSPDELDASLESWILSILQSGPEAMRLQKKLMRQWEELPLGAAIEQGIKTFGESHRTDEPRIYAEKFLNRKSD